MKRFPAANDESLVGVSRFRRSLSWSLQLFSFARDMINSLKLSMLFALASAICTGCSRPPQRLTIFIAGDTNGWITPCGCAANQSGGLARRAQLIDYANLDGETLLFDVGGSAIGTTEYQRLKFESLLDGLNLMSLVGMNVGAAETQFTPDELREIGETTKTTWISSNLQDSNGNDFGEDVLHLNRTGLKVDVTGVVDASLVKSDRWTATEAIPAILKAFRGSDADVKIVLAYFNEAGLRTLADSLPEVDYIIGGPTGQSMSPTKVGSTVVASSTNKGKFVAKISLQKMDKGFRELGTSIVEVSSKLNEAKPQVDNLSAYYAKLAGKDFRSDEAGLVEFVSVRDQYTIAGSQSCIKCHQTDSQVWHNSKHSHAWNVLEMKGASFDPHCQQCHSTGYGLAGGFVNVASSRELIHVGCESCHGPSAAHVENPKKKTPFQAKEQCVRCHDHENSPSFMIDLYWPKVVHGKSK